MIRKLLGNIFRKIASSVGYKLVPENRLFDFQTQPSLQPKQFGDDLPKGFADDLNPNHPKLVEYQERYDMFDSRVTSPSVWTSDRLSLEKMAYFRGHSAFLYQIGSQNRNILGYTLQAYYIQNHDPLNLWHNLEEDGDFGVIMYRAANKSISRDYLDSIMEINFLERNLNISSQDELSILDVGAGYGRLAYRMVSALPNLITYFCTDAVPISTFICEYYINHKGIQKKAQSIPLDEIESELKNTSIDIAINIHSFSECTIKAIDWWLSLIKQHKIPYIFIVPNSGKQLLTNDKKNFHSLIKEKGYQRITMEPKYDDPNLQRYAANPSYYHLFKLQE